MKNNIFITDFVHFPKAQFKNLNNGEEGFVSSLNFRSNRNKKIRYKNYGVWIGKEKLEEMKKKSNKELLDFIIEQFKEILKDLSPYI